MRFLLIGKLEYIKVLSDLLDSNTHFSIDSVDKNQLTLDSKLCSFLNQCISDSVELKIISLPSGSEYKNTSEIARLYSEIRQAFPDLRVVFFGAKDEFAKVIDDKYETHKLFKQLHIGESLSVKEVDDFVLQQTYPSLIKHKSTSGGRGMVLVNDENEFSKWFSNNKNRKHFFYTEPFVRGVEISQSVVKFGTSFYVLPQTVKPPTSPNELKHSDQKPKFCGFFPQDPIIQESVLQIAEEEIEVGVLAGQFICKNKTNTVIVPIEIESRLTGSTPIMTAVSDIDIYKTILQGVIDQRELSQNSKKVEFFDPKRYAIQYISFTKKAQSSLDIDGVYQIKIEDHPGNPVPRCRINFEHENLDGIFSLAKKIGEKIEDDSFYPSIKISYNEIING